MSITSILNTATSALSTNQQALRATSTNVANVNNKDYVRRDVVLETLNINGAPLGVKVAEIRRIAADFLSREILTSRSTAGTFDSLNDIHNRLQGFFGRPDEAGSLPSLVNQALAYASELTLDPVSIPRRMGYLQQITAALNSISRLSDHVQQLRTDTDNSISSKVTEANTLLKEVYELNDQIVKARGLGQDSSALLDIRTRDLRSLSDLMAIKTYEQSNGAMHVMTEDGFALVTENRVQLTYTASGQSGTDVVYVPIQAQTIDRVTGQLRGSATDLDQHISQGQLRGLLTMRDNDLPNLMQQLGELAGNFADQLNAAHADSIAIPPTGSLQGRNTGLLSGDAANFAGATTLAVVAADGTLVRRVDIDFDAGTYSVDGAAATAFAGSTIADIVSGIDAALSGVGTATFSNGALTIDATDPTQGIGFSQPDTGGSSRGGRSFAQFFGLNDLVQAFRPSHFETGLGASDAAGFGAGEEVHLVLRGPTGNTTSEFDYTMTGGETIGDLVNSLNNTSTGLGTYFTFSLTSSGQLTATPNAGYQGFQLDAQGDTSDRGGTGISFSALFGLGRRYQMEQARDLGLADNVMDQPGNLALAHLDIDGTTVVGDLVAAQADGRGAEALAELTTKIIAFDPAGDLRSMATTVGDYAALVLGNVSSNAASAERLGEAAKAVKDEVEFRRSTVEGVNLDEELSNMIVYQTAYNAAARLVTVAKELYDTLLGTVR